MTMPPPPPPPGTPGAYPPPPPGAAPTVVRPTAPPPGAPRKRTWLVWVAALAVLLLVAGGATLWAVLGNDDESTGGPDDPASVVTGDLDADGHGDVRIVQVRGDSGEPTRVWTMLSDGTSFAEATDSEVGKGQWLDLADVDGDGLTDQVWTPITGDGDTSFTVEVIPAEGDPWTAEFPIDPALYGDFYNVTMGDLTGDGRSDLIITSDSVQQGILGVHVAAAQDRGFAPPEQWYAGQSDASYVDVHVGDGDGDGTADVFALTNGTDPADPDVWVSHLQLLTSDGGELTPAAEPVQVWGLGIERGLQGVGDVDGDGDDDPLFANPEGLYTLDVTGEGDPAPRQLNEHGLPETEWRDRIRDFVYSNELWTVTDADGDGIDDVVNMRPDGQGAVMDVYRGAPDGLAPVEEWGTFPCDEQSCADSWQVAAPAK